MKLPLLLSVPHTGLEVPSEVEKYLDISEGDIAADGDVGAREAYGVLARQVREFLTADVARAVVDLNRAEDDRRKDGIVKTHTCWDVPIYKNPPPEGVIERLIVRYHRPYHNCLTDRASRVRAGFDCHTMAAQGPPVGPDAGRTRPAVCLSDCRGTTFPAGWMGSLTALFEKHFPEGVSVNDPFSGGHIIRSHAQELPWVQIELSREPYISFAEKGERVLQVLTEWCAAQPWEDPA